MTKNSSLSLAEKLEQDSKLLELHGAPPFNNLSKKDWEEQQTATKTAVSLMSVEAILEYAQMAAANNICIINRDINPASAKLIMEEGFEPKGLDIKAKSAIVEPFEGHVLFDVSLGGKIEERHYGKYYKQAKEALEESEKETQNINAAFLKLKNLQNPQETDDSKNAGNRARAFEIEDKINQSRVLCKTEAMLDNGDGVKHQAVCFKFSSSQDSSEVTPPIRITDSLSSADPSKESKPSPPLFAIRVQPQNRENQGATAIEETLLFFDPNYRLRSDNQGKSEKSMKRFFEKGSFEILNYQANSAAEELKKSLKDINSAIKLVTEDGKTTKSGFEESKIEALAYKRFKIEETEGEKKLTEQQPKPLTADVDILMVAWPNLEPSERLESEIKEFKESCKTTEEITTIIAKKEVELMVERFSNIDYSPDTGFGSGSEFNYAAISSLKHETKDLSSHGSEDGNPHPENFAPGNYLCFEPGGKLKVLKNSDQILDEVKYLNKEGFTVPKHPNWYEVRTSDGKLKPEGYTESPAKKIANGLGLSHFFSPKKQLIDDETIIDWNKVDWVGTFDKIMEIKDKKTIAIQNGGQADKNLEERFKTEMALFQDLRTLYLLDVCGRNFSYYKTPKQSGDLKISASDTESQKEKLKIRQETLKKFPQAWREKRKELMQKLLESQSSAKQPGQNGNAKMDSVVGLQLRILLPQHARELRPAYCGPFSDVDPKKPEQSR
jgi:hypothetical protein